MYDATREIDRETGDARQDVGRPGPIGRLSGPPMGFFRLMTAVDGSCLPPLSQGKRESEKTGGARYHDPKTTIVRTRRLTGPTSGFILVSRMVSSIDHVKD
jgi:hypothetical protein